MNKIRTETSKQIDPDSVSRNLAVKMFVVVSNFRI